MKKTIQKKMENYENVIKDRNKHIEGFSNKVQELKDNIN